MRHEKVACRTPSKGRDGVTNIPKWKYDLVRNYILEMITDAGPQGIPFANMRGELEKRLTVEEAKLLGSAGWHITVVKLNMEVEGEIKRSSEKGPQKILLA